MEPPAVTATDFDEEEVRLLLAGTDEETREALALINSKLQVGLLGWTKKKSPWLRSSDLPDLWQKLLIEFYEKVVRDKAAGSFDLNKSILPLLCTILHRRAIDVGRAHVREQERAERHEEQLQAIGRALKDTTVGAKWRETNENKRKDLKAEMLAAIATLPEKQRVVCGVYFARFGGNVDLNTLRAEVSKLTGIPETMAAIKGSLQAGRAKVREHLQRKGFHYGGQEDS